MSDDISEFAVVDESDAEQVAEGHAAAHGHEPADVQDVGSERTLREMLMSTSPSEPLEAVESPWDPERGGVRRIFRGVKKMTGVAGIPAVFDIGIGLMEWWTELELGDDQENEESSGGVPIEIPQG